LQTVHLAYDNELAAIHDVHCARIVDANASHAIAHYRSILFVELDEFASKLTPALVPCSPEVTQTREKWSRNIVELPPVVVESPAPECDDYKTKRRKDSHIDDWEQTEKRGKAKLKAWLPWPS
jgi:hypothetical protein